MTSPRSQWGAGAPAGGAEHERIGSDAISDAPSIEQAIRLSGLNARLIEQILENIE